MAHHLRRKRRGRCRHRPIGMKLSPPGRGGTRVGRHWDVASGSRCDSPPRCAGLPPIADEARTDADAASAIPGTAVAFVAKPDALERCCGRRSEPRVAISVVTSGLKLMPIAASEDHLGHETASVGWRWRGAACCARGPRGHTVVPWPGCRPPADGRSKQRPYDGDDAPTRCLIMHYGAMQASPAPPVRRSCLEQRARLLLRRGITFREGQQPRRFILQPPPELHAVHP